MFTGNKLSGILWDKTTCDNVLLALQTNLTFDITYKMSVWIRRKRKEKKQLNFQIKANCRNTELIICKILSMDLASSCLLHKLNIQK